MLRIAPSAQFLRRVISSWGQGFSGYQHDVRTLRDAVPAHWIQLTKLGAATSFTGSIEHVLRHVCLDQAGADRVYANVGLL